MLLGHPTGTGPSVWSFTRIGPVYLWWSEGDGGKVRGWGGDDIWRCDSCSDWQGEGYEAGSDHAKHHGFHVSPDA